jgi:hypothetical protein
MAEGSSHGGTGWPASRRASASSAASPASRRVYSDVARPARPARPCRHDRPPRRRHHGQPLSARTTTHVCAYIHSIHVCVRVCAPLPLSLSVCLCMAVLWATADRAADAVHIVVDGVGQIVVDHVTYSRNVQAACRKRTPCLSHGTHPKGTDYGTDATAATSRYVHVFLSLCACVCVCVVLIWAHAPSCRSAV